MLKSNKRYLFFVLQSLWTRSTVSTCFLSISSPGTRATCNNESYPVKLFPRQDDLVNCYVHSVQPPFGMKANYRQSSYSTPTGKQLLITATGVISVDPRRGTSIPVMGVARGICPIKFVFNTSVQKFTTQGTSLVTQFSALLSMGQFCDGGPDLFCLNWKKWENFPADFKWSVLFMMSRYWPSKPSGWLSEVLVYLSGSL